VFTNDSYGFCHFFPVWLKGHGNWLLSLLSIVSQPLSLVPEQWPLSSPPPHTSIRYKDKTSNFGCLLRKRMVISNGWRNATWWLIHSQLSSTSSKRSAGDIDSKSTCIDLPTGLILFYILVSFSEGPNKNSSYEFSLIVGTNGQKVSLNWKLFFFSVQQEGIVWVLLICYKLWILISWRIGKFDVSSSTGKKKK
jgi:hypothetical protein